MLLLRPAIDFSHTAIALAIIGFYVLFSVSPKNAQFVLAPEVLRPRRVYRYQKPKERV